MNSTRHPLAHRSQACRRLLAETRITAEGPGTILRDLVLLMDAIGPQGFATKSKRGNLPSGPLPWLNARLNDPIELGLTRPLLKDFPNLAGLSILLRVLALVRTDGSRLAVDEARLAAWQALSPTEQYLALLEAWLLDADGQVLGGEAHNRVDGPDSTLWFLSRVVGPRWKTFEEWIHISGCGLGGSGVSAWNTQLMMRLGLIEGVPRPLSQRSTGCASRGWMLWKARRTPWGEAVAWAILEHLAAQDGVDPEFPMPSPDEEKPSGMMRAAFQEFYPEAVRSFGPEPTAVTPGVYNFKLSFHPTHGQPDVWRRLAVPDHASLDELCQAVLKEFNFWDDQHLHVFRYRDRQGRPCSYWHPECETEPFSDMVSLGEIGLPEKEMLRLDFDFGAKWHFLLRLEKIAPPDPQLEEIQVIASNGQAPKQSGGME